MSRPGFCTGSYEPGAADTERMKQAALGPIDCVLDISPPHGGVRPVRAAALTVRPYGRVVLMGGIARAEAD